MILQGSSGELLYSMISTPISTRCTADFASACTRLLSGILAAVASIGSRLAAILVTMSTPSMGLVTLLLSSPPASAGPPFIADDREPTDYQHWELYLFSQGMQETRETSGVAPPSCDCNYGFLPNVQLHLQPGMAFAKTNDGSLRRAGSRQSPSTLCWRRRQAMSIADSVPAG